MHAYIEIVSENVIWGRQELQPFHSRPIGEFTRENISSFLEGGNSFETGIYGWVDFHAVCGDIDIPWATEEARLIWEKVMSGKFKQGALIAR